MVLGRRDGVGGGGLDVRQVVSASGLDHATSLVNVEDVLGKKVLHGPCMFTGFCVVQIGVAIGAEWHCRRQVKAIL